MFVEVYFLAVFLPYFLLAFWVTRLIVKNEETVKRKVIGGMISASIFYLIPFGDDLAGRIYLQYLCMTEGGPHVYQTVKLGPEYWNEDGSAKFIYPKGHKKYGSINTEYFEGKYLDESYGYEQIYKFGIRKSSERIKNYKNLLLAEYIKFRFSGGWIARNMGFNASKKGCSVPQYFFIKLIKKTFIKS